MKKCIYRQKTALINSISVVAYDFSNRVVTLIWYVLVYNSGLLKLKELILKLNSEIWIINDTFST